MNTRRGEALKRRANTRRTLGSISYVSRIKEENLLTRYRKFRRAHDRTRKKKRPKKKKTNKIKRIELRPVSSKEKTANDTTEQTANDTKEQTANDTKEQTENDTKEQNDVKKVYITDFALDRSEIDA